MSIVRLGHAKALLRDVLLFEGDSVAETGAGEGHDPPLALEDSHEARVDEAEVDGARLVVDYGLHVHRELAAEHEEPPAALLLLVDDLLVPFFPDPRSTDLHAWAQGGVTSCDPPFCKSKPIDRGGTSCNLSEARRMGIRVRDA